MHPPMIGTVTVRTSNTFLVIHREQLRQVECSSRNIGVWFEGEETPFTISIEEEAVLPMIYSDILDESQDIAWMQLDDEEPWTRNGKAIE